MSIKKRRRIKYLALILTPALLIALFIAISAMSSMSVAQSSVPVEFEPCTQCHDDTTLITGKATAWEESVHGSGDAYVRGTSSSCAGCHSGGGFSAMVMAGLKPNEVTSGDPDPTRQTCRACHQIHTTATSADWALETTSAVDLYALTGVTFDGGNGNLCANCHQPRRTIADPVGGIVSGINSHWGPHHGPQSSMMLGAAGAGPAASGSPSAHYSVVADTCVTCHMGSNQDHDYEPRVATCQGCHAGATNFDINGVQSTVQAKLDQLKSLLVNAGVLACEVDVEGVESCHPSVSSAPENEASALWNWIYINNEDGSKGVHNSDYTIALLDASIAGIACDGAPVIGMGSPSAYWASMADYTAGLLSVDYTVSNSGATNAFNVNVNNSMPGNGVMLASTMPIAVGNIAASASAPATIQYLVPPGVQSFKTVNGATAEDNCGASFTYGMQPPTP